MEKYEIINGKKYKISVKMYLPENPPKEIILALHGFGGDKESSAVSFLAEKLILQDIAVVCFDFPGHGKSEVSADFFTIQNCISDIETVETYLRELFASVNISIFATSFGAYVFLLKYAKNGGNYRNIILRAPAIEMAKIFKENLLKTDFSEFEKNGYVTMGYEREMKIPFSYYSELKENDVMKIYQSFPDVKFDIIQGDCDDIAPFEDTIKFKNGKNNVSIYVIEGADHRMKKSGDLDKMVEYVNMILKK